MLLLINVNLHIVIVNLILYLRVAPPAAVDNVTVIPSTVLAFIHWNLKDDGGYPITNISIRYKNEMGKQWHYVNPHSISLTHVSNSKMHNSPFLMVLRHLVI